MKSYIWECFRKGAVVLSRKPGFVWRYLRFLAETRLLGRTPLRSLCFASTYQCDFKCEHCYAQRFERPDVAPLSFEEKTALIDQAAALGAMAVDFIGGEAALATDFIDLVRHASRRSLFVGVASNGFQMTRERLETFYRAGLDGMEISIDSGLPEEHDRLRKQPGAYARAMQAVRDGREIGLACQILTTVTRGFTRTEGFRRMVDLCIKEQIPLAFNAMIPFGSFEGRHDLMVSEDDLQEMDRLHEAHSYIRRDVHATPEKFGRTGCPAFKQLIYVSEYGDVMPCPFLHIAFGNIRKESLEVIRNRGLAIPRFGTYHPVCTPAEDKEFVDRMHHVMQADGRYPLQAASVFSESDHDAPDSKE